MANLEYDKALASFKLAIDEGDDNEEIAELSDIIETYLKANKEYEAEAYTAAKDTIAGINSGYTKFSIRTDIDTLKENIEVALQSLDEASDETNNEEENGAQSNTEAENTTVSQKVEYEKRLSVLLAETAKNSGMTTLEMNDYASAAYEQWDAMLNEIYGVIKEQMSDTDFEKLKEEERQWIVDRDATAKQNALKYEGGTMANLEYISSLENITKDRCYELVEGYMK